ESSGFLFASVDPVVDFDTYTCDGLSRIDENAFASVVLTDRREYEINAHWALYCENYLEGFHIPYVHRGLNAVVDYLTYATELFRYSSLQTALDGEGKIGGLYFFIFPNTMFNFYPWGISVNIVRPVTLDRTIVE